MKNKKLRTLLLSGNLIGDIGLGNFSEFIGYGSFSLEHMDFSCNGITDEGASTLGRSLQSNKSLLTVILRQNQIGKDGGLALREFVGHNKTLLRLNLENNAC